MRLSPISCAAAVLLAVCLAWLPTLVLAAPPARVLAFGDSNTWGWTPVATAFPTSRYPRDSRWPEVMRTALGAQMEVLVDGLSARTFALDHPEPLGTLSPQDFNGLERIDDAVARELPLDLVILMLGSNDVASDQHRSTREIGEDAAQMIRKVRGIQGGVATAYPAPQVLLVAPPALGDMTRTPIGARFDAASVAKSRALAAVLRGVAAREGAAFLDARSVADHFGGIDGIHLSADQHRALGKALAGQVRALLGRPRSAHQR